MFLPPMLVWAVAAVLLLAGGWFASAWFHQRKIDLLQLQLKLVRQTANEHAKQARHQIGLLQADLASRPPPLRAPPPPAEDDDDPARRTPSAVDRFVVHEDGFAKTMIGANGFQPTQLMR